VKLTVSQTEVEPVGKAEKYLVRAFISGAFPANDIQNYFISLHSLNSLVHSFGSYMTRTFPKFHQTSTEFKIFTSSMIYTQE
jgi:hypothetical protein